MLVSQNPSENPKNVQLNSMNMPWRDSTSHLVAIQSLSFHVGGSFEGDPPPARNSELKSEGKPCNPLKTQSNRLSRVSLGRELHLSGGLGPRR